MAFDTQISSINNAAICIANMLQDHLTRSLNQIDKKEDSRDYRENTASSHIKASLCLSPAVNYGTGTIQPGEHPAPICPPKQSSTNGVVSAINQNSRWGFGNLRNPEQQS